jgi:hypothetical protein
MTPRQRPFAAARVPAILAATLTLLLIATAAPASAGQIRITAVSNATLRAMPDAGSDVVAQVPLGTEVVEAGPAGLDKTWVRVRLADTREGWLLASLTRSLDPVWRWPTFDAIIASRLARTGDGFPAASELVAFVERVVPEYTTPEGRAGIELARLRAVEAALRSIPFGGGRREPYASWLAGRKHLVTYDEPGGRWMLAPASIWALHAQYQGTPAADDIAWLAATNGMPGECEGFLMCYLDVQNRLQGEYLRREPDGRHVAEAVAVVKRTADLLLAPAQPHQAWQFDKARDCRDLATGVDALIEAVRGTVVAEREAAVASLAAMKGFCQ